MKGAAGKDGAVPAAAHAAAERSAHLCPHRRQRPPRLRLPPPPPPPPPPPDHLCRPLEPAPLASPRRAPSDRFPGAPQSAFTGGRSLETDAELSCMKQNREPGLRDLEISLPRRPATQDNGNIKSNC
ncbi:WAS/WASL-interacting protein family member 3-like [Corvus hawaiiensis]|uniref:WAS/WASL-interacting protein family member 3-like n=1 Tax=Corvus hawaiiensis TaxID=134902 RepID=UPI002018792B|nr:WAS/WASL-interacting protein family member 3-like [Corvus hawaiiensis]